MAKIPKDQEWKIKGFHQSLLVRLTVVLLILSTFMSWGYTASANEVIIDTIKFRGTIEIIATENTRIHDIQGASHTSPFVDQEVSDIPGIVTAVRSNGFYLQDSKPDADDSTSEGIFVYTSSEPTVAVGDSILVSGTVTEFRPGGSDGTNNLTTTQISNPTIVKQSTNNRLPIATVLGKGGRAIPTQVIDNDAVSGSVENPATTFDPAEDGIDFYESLEGMLVQVNNPVAVGPTNRFGEIPVLADKGVNSGIRTPRGGIVIQPEDFNPERIFIDDAIIENPPQAQVGDTFDGSIVGIMDYSFGNFKLLNTAPLPKVISGGLTHQTTNLTASEDKLTVATFNVENLDPSDGRTKFTRLASAVVNNLQSPDIISLEEVQDNNGPKNDSIVDANTTYQTLINAIALAGGPNYNYRQINPEDDKDGGQPGGNIRVGFLFNPNRVNFIDRPGGTSTTNTTVIQGISGVELSASPGRLIDSNLSDGDAFEESRKPLVGEFVFNGNKLFIVTNHFNSKGGDQPLFGRFQPPTLNTESQRIQQALVVKDFVESILAEDPDANVIVMGDLNDFQFSKPITTLEDDILNILVDTLPPEERYTYVFEGNSQVLDHILVTKHLAKVAEFDIVRINAEFTDQVSDHDPVVARFTLERV
jgi:predicted extracellular nuclease